MRVGIGKIGLHRDARSARPRRAKPTSPRHDAARPEPVPASVRAPGGAKERAMREGGPQDSALYICRCGSAFQAAVSASVACPHCGDAQAW